MPDENEKPQNLSGRQRPNLSDLANETTEDDLWHLEEDLALPSSETSDRGESSTNSDQSAIRNPQPDRIRQEPRQKLGTPPATLKEIDPDASVQDPEKVEELPSSPKPTGHTSGPVSEPASVAPPREEAKTADPHARDTRSEPPNQPEEEIKNTPGSPDKSQVIEPKERLGLIAFGVIFLGIAVWWTLGLFSSISTTRLGDDLPRTPIEGDFVELDKAETYWREPVREGANADIAGNDVEFVPILSVSISSGNKGVIRAIFRNEQSDFVGDSISKSFTNGVFDSNGEKSIEFPATDGFKSSGAFNGYRVGDQRWTIEVFEGPSSEASGSEFKLLFTTPISSNRQ